MVRMVKSCVRSVLKLVNSGIGMIGIAMILYGVWLTRVWQREMGQSPFGESDFPAPWFIYAFLSVGITLCVITCSGHIAAETANGCCLYLYMLFVFLLLMVEAGITADIFLNRDWEKDFPKDPSRSFDQFKNFIRSNFDICKWICFSIVTTQCLSLLLAMILKALGPHQCYDSDEERTPARVPLLKNLCPSRALVDPIYGSKNDGRSVRISDKTTR